MTSTVELWIAIPLGIKLGLTAVEAGAAAAAGAAAGVMVICRLGAQARARLVTRFFGAGEAVLQSRSARLFHAYGAPGLGMLGVLSVGAPLSSALGLVIGADTDRIIKWMVFGILFWTSVMILIAHFGTKSLIAV